MADIKTRDAVKGTIKTLNKAAVASERMKSAYTGVKGKTEQGCYAEENSPEEYASDKAFHAMGRIRGESMRQFNRRGQKSVQSTRENIGKARDKITDFKVKQAEKVVKQKKTQAAAEQSGSQIRLGIASRPSVSDMHVQTELSQTGTNQLIKTRQQGKRTIKTTARNAEKTIKSTTKGTVKAAEKGVKTARTTSKSAIKTAEETAKAAQKAMKASAKTTQKAARAAKSTAKATAEVAKAAVRVSVSAVKGIIAATKALVSALIAGGWIAVLIVIVVVLLGCALSLFGGGSGSNAYIPVSAEVQAYEPLIQKYAKQHGIPEYVELVKAVMMQESGGKGNDPMQASECGYNTRYPNVPNGIIDPEYSINIGIQNLAACLNAAGVKNPIDMDNIKLALQGYNFGNGYISWAKTNYGGYSYANAVEFSAMQAEKHGWSSYGDTQYVAHVLRYYPYGRAFTGGGNQAIVEVALTQLANYFDESQDEDIFDYIPPQKTNQIFTPRWVVEKMVNQLEENNPGCFDDPTKTFADLYMKSGLYITEIVKRLYRSEAMKKAFPDDKERVRHILSKQVYGMAPTRIIYLIATNYILGFDEEMRNDTHNFVEADAADAAKNDVLKELVNKNFG